MLKNGRYNLDYDDGDRERNVPSQMIVAAEPSKFSTSKKKKQAGTRVKVSGTGVGVAKKKAKKEEVTQKVPDTSKVAAPATQFFALRKHCGVSNQTTRKTSDFAEAATSDAFEPTPQRFTQILQVRQRRNGTFGGPAYRLRWESDSQEEWVPAQNIIGGGYNVLVQQFEATRAS